MANITNMENIGKILGTNKKLENYSMRIVFCRKISSWNMSYC